MRIQKNTIPTMTFSAFADMYGLTMRITERSQAVCPNPASRYYANFEHTETLVNGMFLRGDYGNGATPQEAIENYRRELISGTILVVDSYKPTRREIVVPHLTPDHDDSEAQA